MSAVEELCAHWIIHYEAYRAWKQFERDGRADYHVQRWNMLSAKQVHLYYTILLLITNY